jgi:hypothetical protein
MPAKAVTSAGGVKISRALSLYKVKANTKPALCKDLQNKF